MQKHKNGKIEFLRFFFCMAVILFHIREDFPDRTFILKGMDFFREGRIGVEFFFLTTGYLTASKIFRTKDDGAPLGDSTWQFMKHKIAAILPFHIIAITIKLLYSLWIGRKLATSLMNALPNIFLLQMTGLPGKNLLSVEWYLSSMLLVLLIVYPLCRRYYDAFTTVIAPVLGLCGAGFMIQRIGYMGNPKVWLGFTYAGNIRALAMICLGMWGFEVIRRLKMHEMSTLSRSLATVVEAGGYAIVICYIMTDRWNIEYSGTIAVLMAVLVALTFSEIPYGTRLFNNPLIYFFGKCSLPIYLSQNLIRAAAIKFWGNGLGTKQLVIQVAVLVILLGAVTQIAVDLGKMLLKKNRQIREQKQR